MPKIICHSPAKLSGQVGSVEFRKGQGHTEDETMLAFFADNPGRFDVVEDGAEVPDFLSPESDEVPDEGIFDWIESADDEDVKADRVAAAFAKADGLGEVFTTNLVQEYGGYLPPGEQDYLADAPDPEPDAAPSYDELSDDEVAEAYAVNVGGRATKRESQVAALIALESGDEADDAE